jgi:leucyl/phenylalanyl-tRNA--protein transferase
MRLHSAKETAYLAPMPLPTPFRLTSNVPETWFPPVDQAIEGVVAYGGELSPERLIAAYTAGIFPWYGDDSPVLWWSPEPRCILRQADVVVTKSMRTSLRRFQFRVNTAFGEVIRGCRDARLHAEGTWIHPEVIEAYEELHRRGHAVSVESWQDNRLVGGLYGVVVGRMFFGESMFSAVPNASKAALIELCTRSAAAGFGPIDCQMSSPHLLSMGATEVPRSEFLDLLATHVVPFASLPSPALLPA